MNLGLGNLIELKRYLLASALVSGTDYDVAITAIGKGVAKALERYCNRQFERVAGAVEEFSADRRFWVVNRYPIEAITSIEQRDDVATGFVGLTVNDVIVNRDDKAGLIRFGNVQGTHLSQLRLTYTGGYWFDTTETDPPSTTPPAGQALLPEDVKLAWYLQCAEVWRQKDKLGTEIVENGARAAAGLELVPEVKRMMGQHVRFQVT